MQKNTKYKNYFLNDVSLEDLPRMFAQGNRYPVTKHTVLYL